jgi:hypothetical protein
MVGALVTETTTTTVIPVPVKVLLQAFFARMEMSFARPLGGDPNRIPLPAVSVERSRKLVIPQP